MTHDKFYVYRPLLDLIGFTEGTDKGDGYNETLAYGKMLDGVATKGKGRDIVLTDKTLTSIDAIQTKMLQDPDNARWNSSAIGRYQIVRTTLHDIKSKLNLAGAELFDEEMQDRMACYLLGVRGIDKFLAGRLKEDTLINNLAQEWASLPTTEGKGHYAGQHTPITVARMRAVLEEVKRRHKAGQPDEVVVVEKETVPPVVEEQVKQKTSFWQWLTGLIGSGALSLGWIAGMDWQAIVAGGAVLIGLLLVILLLRRQLVAAVREIKEGLA